MLLLLITCKVVNTYVSVNLLTKIDDYILVYNYIKTNNSIILLIRCYTLNISNISYFMKKRKDRFISLGKFSSSSYLNSGGMYAILGIKNFRICDVCY